MLLAHITNQTDPRTFNVVQDYHDDRDNKRRDRSTIGLDFRVGKWASVNIPHLFDDGGSSMLLPKSKDLDLFAQFPGIGFDLGVNDRRVMCCALELENWRIR